MGVRAGWSSAPMADRFCNMYHEIDYIHACGARTTVIYAAGKRGIPMNSPIGFAADMGDYDYAC